MNSLKKMQEYIGVFGALAAFIAGFISGQPSVLITALVFACAALLYLVLSKRESTVVSDISSEAGHTKIFRYTNGQRYAAIGGMIFLIGSTIVYIFLQTEPCLKYEEPIVYVASFEDENNAFQKNLVSNLEALIDDRSSPGVTTGKEVIAHKNPQAVGEITERFCNYKGLVVHGNASFSEGPQYLNCYITLVNMLDSVYTIKRGLKTIQFTTPDFIKLSFHQQASCAASFVLSLFETSRGKYAKAIGHLQLCMGNNGIVDGNDIDQFLILNKALLGDNNWEHMYDELTPKEKRQFKERFDVIFEGPENTLIDPEPSSEPIVAIPEDKLETVDDDKKIEKDSVGDSQKVVVEEDLLLTSYIAVTKEPYVLTLYGTAVGFECNDLEGHYRPIYNRRSTGTFSIGSTRGSTDLVQKWDQLVHIPLDSVFWCRDFNGNTIFLTKFEYEISIGGMADRHKKVRWRIVSPCRKKRLIGVLQDAYSLDQAVMKWMKNNQHRPDSIDPIQVKYDINYGR